MPDRTQARELYAAVQEQQRLDGTEEEDPVDEDTSTSIVDRQRQYMQAAKEDALVERLERRIGGSTLGQ